MRAQQQLERPASRATPQRRARVAHVTSVHDALDGRIFSRECRTLARAGYDVVIVAPAGSSAARDPSDAERVVDGVRIQTVSAPRNRLERLLVTGPAVIRAALRERAEIYHLHDPELLPSGLLLRLLGKRVIYDAHEDVPKDVAGKQYVPRVLRGALARVVGVASRACTRTFHATIIAVPSIASSVRGRRIVIYNYPVLEELLLAPVRRWTSRKRAAIYAGFINERRGLYEMIAAMSSPAVPNDARLTLVGKFDNEAQQEGARHIPGWERVDYIGWTDESALWRLMADAKVGIVTLHPTPTFLDSMPMKLFEYMALGLPVVASDFPAWRAIIETSRCGLLVDPLDPRAIGEAIGHLLSHPDEAEAMGRSGREAVMARFAWQGEGEKLLELYADMCPRS
jgi:glycosyltransferase involved in cell wall biosynthesis